MKKGIVACVFILLFSNKFSFAGDQDTIPCQEIKIMCGQVFNGNYVIKNKSEYQALLDVRSPHPDCGGYELPAIDFNQYTLVGVETSVAGCAEPESEHYVVKNSQTGNYQFVFILKQKGMCKINFGITIFCLIPAIDNSSKVEFIRK